MYNSAANQKSIKMKLIIIILFFVNNVSSVTLPDQKVDLAADHALVQQGGISRSNLLAIFLKHRLLSCLHVLK